MSARSETYQQERSELYMEGREAVRKEISCDMDAKNGAKKYGNGCFVAIMFCSYHVLLLQIVKRRAVITLEPRIGCVVRGVSVGNNTSVLGLNWLMLE